MTKAAKLRRRREQKRQAEKAMQFKYHAQFGGIEIQTLNVSEITHARLNVARTLNQTLVLKPWSGETWRIVAVDNT